MYLFIRLFIHLFIIDRETVLINECQRSEFLHAITATPSICAHHKITWRLEWPCFSKWRLAWPRWDFSVVQTLIFSEMFRVSTLFLYLKQLFNLLVCHVYSLLFYSWKVLMLQSTWLLLAIRAAWLPPDSWKNLRRNLQETLVNIWLV